MPPTRGKVRRHQWGGLLWNSYIERDFKITCERTELGAVSVTAGVNDEQAAVTLAQRRELKRQR
ncbi:MAG: hypothetical protein ACLTDS_10715 [Bianqueaceae bacterium]